MLVVFSYFTIFMLSIHRSMHFIFIYWNMTDKHTEGARWYLESTLIFLSFDLYPTKLVHKSLEEI